MPRIISNLFGNRRSTARIQEDNVTLGLRQTYGSDSTDAVERANRTFAPAVALVHDNTASGGFRRGLQEQECQEALHPQPARSAPRTRQSGRLGGRARPNSQDRRQLQQQRPPENLVVHRHDNSNNNGRMIPSSDARNEEAATTRNATSTRRRRRQRQRNDGSWLEENFSNDAETRHQDRRRRQTQQTRDRRQETGRNSDSSSSRSEGVESERFVNSLEMHPGYQQALLDLHTQQRRDNNNENNVSTSVLRSHPGMQQALLDRYWEVREQEMIQSATAASKAATTSPGAMAATGQDNDAVCAKDFLLDQQIALESLFRQEALPHRSNMVSEPQPTKNQKTQGQQDGSHSAARNDVISPQREREPRDLALKSGNMPTREEGNTQEEGQFLVFQASPQNQKVSDVTMPSELHLSPRRVLSRSDYCTNDEQFQAALEQAMERPNAAMERPNAAGINRKDSVVETRLLLQFVNDMEEGGKSNNTTASRQEEMFSRLLLEQYQALRKAAESVMQKQNSDVACGVMVGA